MTLETAPAPTIIDAQTEATFATHYQAASIAELSPSVQGMFEAQDITPAVTIEAPSEKIDQLGETATADEEALIQDIISNTEIGSVAFASPSLADKMGSHGLRAFAQRVAKRQTDAGFESSNVQMTQGLKSAIPGTFTYGEREAFVGHDPIQKACSALDEAIGKRQKYGSEALSFFELSDGSGMVDVRYSFRPRYGFSNSGRESYMQAAFKIPANQAMRLLSAVEHRPSVIQRVVKDQALALGVKASDWPQFVAKDEKGVPLTMDKRTLVVGAYGEGGGAYEPMGNFIMLHQDKSSSIMPDLSSAGVMVERQEPSSPLNHKSSLEDGAPDAFVDNAFEFITHDIMSEPTTENRLTVLTDTIEMWNDKYGETSDAAASGLLAKFHEKAMPMLTQLLRQQLLEDASKENLGAEQVVERCADHAADAMEFALDDPSPYNKPLMFARAYGEIAKRLPLEMAAAGQNNVLPPVVQRQAWKLRGLDMSGGDIEAIVQNPTIELNPSHPHFRELYKFKILAAALR